MPTPAHFPPLCDYNIVNDSSPGTHLWSTVAGAFVAYNDATYLAWLSQLIGTDPSTFGSNYLIKSCSSASGGAATSLEVVDTGLFTNGEVFAVQGTGSYDGNRTVSVLDSTHLTIPVAFAGNATGYLAGAAFFATATQLNAALNAAGLALIPTTRGPYSQNTLTGVNTDQHLTNPLAAVTDLTITAGISVFLPSMNAPNSIPVGVPFTVKNNAASTGSSNIRLFDNSGADVPGLFGTLVFQPGATVTLANYSNATAAGQVKVLSVSGAGAPIPVGVGGTGADSFTRQGLIIAGAGNQGDPLSAIALGNNGQLLIQANPAGQGSPPVWVNVGVGVGDTNTTLGSNGGAIYASYTTAALTAPRTWTLSAANNWAAGAINIIDDAAGGVSSTNTLSIARHGADTINGGSAAVVLNRARGFVVLKTDGVSNWTVIGGKGALQTTDLSDVTAGGSWTPSDQSGAGLIFSSVSTQFDKIGNRVFVSAEFTYPSTADPSTAVIGGLPITVPNQGYGDLSMSACGISGFALPSVSALTKNTTTLRLFPNGSGGFATNAQLSLATIRLNFSYPAT